jgi:hypothetical protein
MMAVALKNKDDGGSSDGNEEYGSNSDGEGDIEQSTKSFGGRNGSGSGNGDGNRKGDGESKKTTPSTVYQ